MTFLQAAKQHEAHGEAAQWREFVSGNSSLRRLLLLQVQQLK